MFLTSCEANYKNAMQNWSGCLAWETLLVCSNTNELKQSFSSRESSQESDENDDTRMLTMKQLFQPWLFRNFFKFVFLYKRNSISENSNYLLIVAMSLISVIQKLQKTSFKIPMYRWNRKRKILKLLHPSQAKFELMMLQFECKMQVFAISNLRIWVLNPLLAGIMKKRRLARRIYQIFIIIY